MRWNTRIANRDEIPKLLSLFQAVYNRPLSSEYWQWRYYGNPECNTEVLVIEHQGRIIGMRPMSSFTFKVADKEIRATLFTNVITHPSFRRMGVFSSLIKEAAQLSKNRGDKFIYTFPNKKSFPAYMKIKGWNHIDSIPLYIKPLRIYNYLHRKVKKSNFVNSLSALRKLEINPPAIEVKECQLSISKLNRFDKQIDELWNNIHDKYTIILKRDSQYLNWRYIQRPDVDYIIFCAESRDKIKGYIVLKTDKLFGCWAGLVVDILSEDEKTCVHLIAQAIKLFRELKIEVVGCLITDIIFYPRALRKNGFFRFPNLLCPKEFYVVCYCNSNLSNFPGEVQNFSKWFLTWGDTDTV